MPGQRLSPSLLIHSLSGLRTQQPKLEKSVGPVLTYYTAVRNANPNTNRDI